MSDPIQERNASISESPSARAPATAASIGSAAAPFAGASNVSPAAAETVSVDDVNDEPLAVAEEVEFSKATTRWQQGNQR